MSQDAKRYQFNSSRMICEQFEDETVLVNIESGYYYSLSPSGAEILQLLEDGISSDNLARALFGDTPAIQNLQSAIHSFVDQLAAENVIVERQPERAAAALPDLPRYASGASYELPQLKRFDDVRDLLLIDPIHQVDPEYGWPKRSNAEEPVEPRH